MAHRKSRYGIVKKTFVYRDGKRIEVDHTPKEKLTAPNPWKDHASDGAAVHPADRESAMEHAKLHGVPTHFDEQGRPHFRSRAHQKKYLRLIAMHNNDDYS